MRRAFELPEADREFLAAYGRPWESIIEGAARWLLLHEFAVPPGYNHSAVMAAFQIEQNYPDTQLDMVWFFPHLARSDGKGINNLSSQNVDGKDFQRWSRHRTETNKWRVGEDYLGTHVPLVIDWLSREFGRNGA